MGLTEIFAYACVVLGASVLAITTGTLVIYLHRKSLATILKEEIENYVFVRRKDKNKCRVYGHNQPSSCKEYCPYYSVCYRECANKVLDRLDHRTYRKMMKRLHLSED